MERHRHRLSRCLRRLLVILAASIVHAQDIVLDPSKATHGLQIDLVLPKRIWVPYDSTLQSGTGELSYSVDLKADDDWASLGAQVRPVLCISI